MKNLMLALTAAFLMAGCAFSGDNDTAEGKIAEDLREARAEIAPVVGLWAGTLTRDGQVLDVSLSVQETLIPTGSTADGRTIYRAAPAATFTSVDGRYNQAFSGTFLVSTGELILNATATNLTLDQIQTLSLHLRGETLTGSVTTPGGYLGRLNLRLQGRQSDGSQIDNEQRRAEALREVYQPLVGTWRGNVVNPRGSTTPRLTIELTVVIDEEPTSTGRLMPILRATYNRVDQNYSDILRQGLDIITFAYANNPPMISMSGTEQRNVTGRLISGYISLVGRFATNPDGSLNRNRIIGTHTNKNLGITGQMDLRKISSSTDESEGTQLPDDSNVPRPTPRPRR